jgi:phage baseplate assembly protein W
MAQDISILRYEQLPPDGEIRRQRVSVTWGTRTKTVNGVLKLAQMVIKLLLTTPGSDPFAPSLGTVIPLLLKRGVTQSSQNALKTDIMTSIQDLERQIFNLQAAEAIPDDERLQELVIRRVEYLTDEAEWAIDLSVLSQAGEQVPLDISPFLKGK